MWTIEIRVGHDDGVDSIISLNMTIHWMNILPLDYNVCATIGHHFNAALWNACIRIYNWSCMPCVHITSQGLTGYIVDTEGCQFPACSGKNCLNWDSTTNNNKTSHCNNGHFLSLYGILGLLWNLHKNTANQLCRHSYIRHNHNHLSVKQWSNQTETEQTVHRSDTNWIDLCNYGHISITIRGFSGKL